MLLHSADIIHSALQVYMEKNHALTKLPNLCPYNSYFHPYPSLKQADVSPIPWSIIDFDFTMTSSKCLILMPFPPGVTPTTLPALSIKKLVKKEQLMYI